MLKVGIIDLQISTPSGCTVISSHPKNETFRLTIIFYLIWKSVSTIQFFYLS